MACMYCGFFPDVTLCEECYEARNKAIDNMVCPECGSEQAELNHMKNTWKCKLCDSEWGWNW
jgi:hypothetical protein